MQQPGEGRTFLQPLLPTSRCNHRTRQLVDVSYLTRYLTFPHASLPRDGDRQCEPSHAQHAGQVACAATQTRSSHRQHVKTHGCALDHYAPSRSFDPDEACAYVREQVPCKVCPVSLTSQHRSYSPYWSPWLRRRPMPHALPEMSFGCWSSAASWRRTSGALHTTGRFAELHVGARAAAAKALHELRSMR